VDFGVPLAALFNANAKLLDTEARAHGHPDSNHGGLIFPGVTITIP